MTLKPARLQWSDDGSLASADFGDIYFQRGKGAEESRYVFLEKNRLSERFQNLGPGNVFRVGELGFGTGLNFLLTAALFYRTASTGARLFYVSIEKHPLAPLDLEKIHSFWPEHARLSEELRQQYPPMIEGFHALHFDRITLLLLWGDVADVLPQLSGKLDAWYMDGFAPDKNPAMWDEDICRHIFACTAPGGTLSTFSAAGSVRRGLETAGFCVKKEKGFGSKRDMTVASFPGIRAPDTQKNITVIGAGIAGCAISHALARRGHGVTLIDRHETYAAETSGNPVAILYPKLTVDESPMGAFHRHAFLYTRNLARRLPSWKETGVLHLDMNEEEKTRHQRLAARYPEEFCAYKEGLWQPTAGVLSPPEFCQDLINHPNIETKFGTVAKETPEGPVVISCGIDSQEFAHLPLQSLRGQVTYLTPTPASKKLERVICHDGYITPEVGGLHYIGATFQREPPGAADLRTEDHAENLRKLNASLPNFEFSEKNIAGGRAGYRATTPDKLPLIGPCPDEKNFPATIPDLYVSAGFGAHGMSGAPLAGEIIAAMICGDPLPVPKSLMPYLLPERFILRDKKRKKT